jgi:AbrB family looped-hinge helix DNA binding protein
MGALKSSSISKKGQTTIPVEIRQKLSLKEGDSVVYDLKANGEITLRKAPTIESLDYLKAVELSFANEWMSDEDDDL